MLSIFGLGQIEAARLKHTTTLPRFSLQFIIEVHRIMLNAADVGAVVQPMDIRRRMPCGP